MDIRCLQVNPKFGTLIQADLYLRGLDLKGIPFLESDIESSVTSAQEQPGHLHASILYPGQLTKEKLRIFTYADHRTLLEFHLGEAAGLGGDRETFLNRCMNQCLKRTIEVGELEVDFTLNETQSDRPNLREFRLGSPGRCKENEAEKRQRHPSVP